MTKLNIEIKKPRIVCRQTARSNHLKNSIEDYYRVSIYIPLLDNILEVLKCRFINEKNQAVLKLSQIIPRNIIEADDDDLDQLIKLVKKYFSFEEYDEIIEVELKSELNLWKSKWIREKSEGMLYFNIILTSFILIVTNTIYISEKSCLINFDAV